MIAAIVKEIALAPRSEEQGNSEGTDSGKETATTLYFGGGTPSILSADELKQLIDAVQQQFIFYNNIEITLEANPDDLTQTKLREWQQAGINRLSVGIQSFIDEELSWMNRAHTAHESLSGIDMIRDAGFDNFSVDLIYGSSLLTDDNWKRNVATVIQKNIPHISCYALTVEPKTALDKMIALNKKAAVDPEKQARHFLLLMDWMQEAGYEHYEISNYAKPGMRSQHNSSYWQGKNYYGFGPSAHSFDGKSRRWNVANNALYIQSLKNNTIPFEEEVLTTTQQLNEYIMTSLRTIEGLNLNYISTRFGAQFSTDLLDASKKYIATNKLIASYTTLILTNEGKLFADGIAADLFF